MKHVLACNAGSSSLKLSLFAGSSVQGWALINTVNLPAQHTPTDSPSYSDMLSAWLAPLPMPDQILHRVVHSGRVPEQATPLDDDALAMIRHWLPMAPRHNALTLELISTLQQRWPHLPQFAIYDSGLYASLPEHAASYALPGGISPEWPLRRYGFHGLAHRNQWRQVQTLFGQFPRKHGQSTPDPRDQGRGLSAQADRVISIHLGSGVSVSAWRQGTVVDTSMGFSPLEGPIMARRSGSIDPGILMHLLLRAGLQAPTLDRMLHDHSGLAALAGHDGDMRLILQDLADTGNPCANTAVTQYCYQIRKTIGSYIAVLGGVDAISFGGGVAEHQAAIRQQILAGLEELGIVMDTKANVALNAQEAVMAGSFHAPDSTCALYLTPVNEMDEMLRQYEVFAINQ